MCVKYDTIPASKKNMPTGLSIIGVLIILGLLKVFSYEIPRYTGEFIFEILLVVTQISLVYFGMRWVAERLLRNQIKMAKQDPKAFIEKNVGPNINNKEEIASELGKIDSIERINGTKWIKGVINSAKNEEAKGLMRIEALVKTSDGQEQWYTITSLNNKIIKVEKYFRPIG